MVRPKKSHIAEVQVSDNASGEESAETTMVSKLLEKINELEKKINALTPVQASLEEISLDQKSTNTNIEFDDTEDEFDRIEIRPDAYIKVVSLYPGWLNLSTKASGKGKAFLFKSFGETKRILYSDLVEILEVYRHFLEKGYFYIMNRNVIRKNGLDDVCKSVLTHQNIEMILMGKNDDNIVSLFKSANESQREVITDMLISKMLANEEVDLNLIDKLTRISGIKIIEKYENSKPIYKEFVEKK